MLYGMTFTDVSGAAGARDHIRASITATSGTRLTFFIVLSAHERTAGMNSRTLV